jgi:hypothetical protein
MASDDFNRAAENPLGSPWTTWLNSGLKIATNGYCQIVNASNQETGAYYSSSSVADSSVTIHTVGAEMYAGPLINASSGGNGYVMYSTPSGTYTLAKVTGGSFSTLKTTSLTAPIAGDVLRLVRVGNDLFGYKNGSLVSGWGTATDTTYTTGSPGIYLYNNNVYIDSWTDGVAAGQTLLPSSDITTTGWTASGGGALYAAIDEAVASDTDYITTSTLNAECEVKLQPGSTPGAGSKNLKVRCPAGFTPVGSWTVSLYEGQNLVQAFTTPAPAADTTQSFSVTNTISDYSDLRVRIKSTA